MWWSRILTIIPIAAVGVARDEKLYVQCVHQGQLHQRCMLEDRFPEDVHRCGKEAVDHSKPLWQPEKTTTFASGSGGGQLVLLARNITRRRWRHRIERGFHASARQDALEEDDGGCGDRRDFPAKRRYVLRASKAGSSGPGRSPEACFLKLLQLEDVRAALKLVQSRKHQADHVVTHAQQVAIDAPQKSSNSPTPWRLSKYTICSRHDLFKTRSVKIHFTMLVSVSHPMSTSPVPVIEYVAPASAVTYTEFSPVTEYVAPAPADTIAARSPAIEYVVPTPVVTYAATSSVIENVASAPVVFHAAPATLILRSSL